MTAHYDKAQNPSDPNEYFVQDDEVKNIQQKQKVQSILHAIQYYAQKVWPTVQRAISAIVYFLLSLIKSFFKMVMEEIKSH